MKLAESSSVEYGNSTILFALEYCDRKTLGIEVHPDSSVVVKAPHNSPLEAIQTRVSNRARWITKQQRQFAQYAPTLPAQEYVSGEGYRYLGRQYRLTVRRKSPTEFCTRNQWRDCSDGRFFIHLFFLFP